MELEVAPVEVLKDFTGQSVQVMLEMARGFELHVPAWQGMQPTPVKLRNLPAPHGDCVVVAVGVNVHEVVPVEVTVGVPVTVYVSEDVPVAVDVSVEVAVGVPVTEVVSEEVPERVAVGVGVTVAVAVTDGEKLGVAV